VAELKLSGSDAAGPQARDAAARDGLTTDGADPEQLTADGAAADRAAAGGPAADRAAAGGAAAGGQPSGSRVSASPAQVGLSWVAAQLTPRALWQQHRLFTALAVISLVPRILALLAFRPALLTADSFIYMQGAVNGTLGTIRPSGYSFFLAPFQVLPDPLLAVTIVQHLMGIVIAVIVYALLRYWGLPGWGAALAATPVLLDTRQVALESYILPDTLFALVIIVVVALLLTRRTPQQWQCVTAALLLAYIAVLRGNGAPLVVVAAAFLLIRKVGWRVLAASAAAFAVPVLGYVLIFHSQTGQFNLTSSDGLFLWSRTTSFANCAVIKPPPRLRPLCPAAQTQVKTPARTPAWSVPALLAEPTAADYLWASGAWWRHDAQPGVNAYNSNLGLQFALAAIRAQPLDYLKVSAKDIALVFLATDRPQSQQTMTFTTRPHIAVLPSYYARDERAFAGAAGDTHPVYPFAYFLFLYQQPVYFPGLAFLLVVLAGVAGVAHRWRRWGGMAALPCALAAVSIVTPAFATQALYRYMMVAIPLACVAAGLGFARREGEPSARQPAVLP